MSPLIIPASHLGSTYWLASGLERPLIEVTRFRGLESDHYLHSRYWAQHTDQLCKLDQICNIVLPMETKTDFDPNLNAERFLVPAHEVVEVGNQTLNQFGTRSDLSGIHCRPCCVWRPRLNRIVACDDLDLFKNRSAMNDLEFANRASLRRSDRHPRGRFVL